MPYQRQRMSLPFNSLTQNVCSVQKNDIYSILSDTFWMIHTITLITDGIPLNGVFTVHLVVKTAQNFVLWHTQELQFMLLATRHHQNQTCPKSFTQLHFPNESCGQQGGHRGVPTLVHFYTTLSDVF